MERVYDALFSLAQINKVILKNNTGFYGKTLVSEIVSMRALYSSGLILFYFKLM